MVTAGTAAAPPPPHSGEQQPGDIPIQGKTVKALTLLSLK